MPDWRVGPDDDATALGVVVIGAGIRTGRHAMGLTQQQLAWRVGLSQTAISRLETGTLSGIRYRTLARIVGVLEEGPVYRFPGGPSTLPGGRDPWTAKPGTLDAI